MTDGSRPNIMMFSGFTRAARASADLVSPKNALHTHTASAAILTQAESFAFGQLPFGAPGLQRAWGSWFS